MGLALQLIISRLVERLLLVDIHHVKRLIDAGKLINIIHFIYVTIRYL